MAAAAYEPSRVVSPHIWERVAEEKRDELATLLRHVATAPSLRVLRVSQLDAERLDTELVELLKDQFKQVFSFFKTGARAASSPEMQALVELIVYGCSVGVGNPTPGCALLNLRYRDERTAGSGEQRTGLEGEPLSLGQRFLLGLFTVGAKYGLARLGGIAHSPRYQDSATPTWKYLLFWTLRSWETWYRCAHLANLITFLRNGRYRSPVERLLQARLVYDKPAMNHAISFEFMNRELVWHELSEMLLFLLPLIPAARIRQQVGKMAAALWPTSNAMALPARHSVELLARGPEPLQCHLCETAPIRVPFEASPCGHSFCYYCLR
ncbi:hypothetical protein CYMTET_32938 [Cymbomonas tetramitiformis]|uniref:RING-type E3 ubiquitin transferase (cysteine targeting) n=1 Tax=Cymbomonas tetramitiformis TaxID=36881 RepID=A0AAE0FE09_9CHLO|nr:hypothetical protein CYMTET_32938 [Cymbomonas tetramitiformis]